MTAALKQLKSYLKKQKIKSDSIFRSTFEDDIIVEIDHISKRFLFN